MYYKIALSDESVENVMPKCWLFWGFWDLSQ